MSLRFVRQLRNNTAQSLVLFRQARRSLFSPPLRLVFRLRLFFHNQQFIGCLSLYKQGVVEKFRRASEAHAEFSERVFVCFEQHIRRVRIASFE